MPELPDVTVYIETLESRVLGRRLRTPAGEVDAAAEKDGVLAFIEVKQRVTLAGAADHLKMDLIDYVPCYRTLAGTGCAMAFEMGMLANVAAAKSRNPVSTLTSAVGRPTCARIAKLRRPIMACMLPLEIARRLL